MCMRKSSNTVLQLPSGAHEEQNETLCIEQGVVLFCRLAEWKVRLATEEKQETSRGTTETSGEHKARRRRRKHRHGRIESRIGKRCREEMETDDDEYECDGMDGGIGMEVEDESSDEEEFDVDNR